MTIPTWIPEGKELYLFDIDGVYITASEPFSARYEKEVGKPGMMTTFFMGVFQDCLVGKADLKEEASKHLEVWGWKGNIDSFLDKWFSEEANPNEEITEIMRELRAQGKKCYLITNQEKYRAHYLVENLNLLDVSDGVFSSSGLGVKKPNPRYYDRVLEEIGYKGEKKDVFYIDDDMKNIDTAREMGFDTFYYKA